MLQRGIREPGYWAHARERFGLLPRSFKRTPPGAIWLHAVSVGEVLSAAELLRRLRQRLPAVALYVSTTTVAGRAIATENLRGLADGIFYAPVDYRFAVRNVLRALRPSVLVVLETEIWPNLYRETRRAGCGLLIVNGRISDRSLPRYRALSRFFRRALSFPQTILAQSEQDRERYLALGAPPDRVRVGGNLKYDFTPRAAGIPQPVEKLLEGLRNAQIWIAASTMPAFEAGDVDEDSVVLDAFRELAARHPRLLLILAPRRPERFDTVAAELSESGVRFLRRASLDGGNKLELPAVLLLDTIGELSGLFSIAHAVFMGGTLARRGGHNILEPAFFGKPVIVGPHMENFAAIAREFSAAEAVVEIEGAAALASAVAKLLDRPGMAREVGERARSLAESKRGVADRVTAEIERHRELSFAPRTWIARVLLGPGAGIWGLGARWHRRRAWGNRRSLHTPVVSVGGITMGGAGKTPMVAYLAARLDAAGLVPAILTRGYRRHAPEHSVAVPAGSGASTDLTGDEAQIFVRARVAHVGIGADRYRNGVAMERSLHPAVFLLDDGFQHHRLDRTLDIVSIDALDPLGGGKLFPLGRLREPLQALDRADAFVISRAGPEVPLAGIERRLRRYNVRAPVFHSHIVAESWTDLEWGATCDARELPYKRVVAFCGLASPSGFWQTLDSLGLDAPVRWRFSDHHHYRHDELQRLARRARAIGAEALVTTQKDLMNLPRDTVKRIAPVRLYWLKIGIAMEREEEFLRWLLARIGPRAAFALPRHQSE